MRVRVLLGKNYVARFSDRPDSPYRSYSTHQVSGRKFVFAGWQEEQSRQPRISVLCPHKLDYLSDHVRTLASFPNEVAEWVAFLRNMEHSVRREAGRAAKN